VHYAAYNLPLNPVSIANQAQSAATGAYNAGSTISSGIEEGKGAGDFAGEAIIWVWKGIRQPWDEFTEGWDCHDSYSVGRGAVGIGNEALLVAGIISSARQGIMNLVNRGARDPVTIYRGVNEGHVVYKQALKGEAVPNKRWWDIFTKESTPYEHNAVPGGTRNSPYTSWTTNPEVAENFALRPKGTGVVLRIAIPRSRLVASPNLKEVLLIQNGKVVSESEVLVRGVVRGAAVQRVQP